MVFVIAVLVNTIVINFRIAALTESLVSIEQRSASLQRQIESGRSGLKEEYRAIAP